MTNNNVISIDLGGTNLRAAVVSPEGNIIKKIKEPSLVDVKTVLKKTFSSLMSEDIKAIGIAVAGIIDKSTKKVLISPNLHEIEGFEFQELAPGIPLIVENDASSAAIGEMWLGAGREFNDFILLTLGTGIGGGIIYNRELLDVAAEVGHMSIDHNGAKCPCGNNGCLELYASARAITGSVTSAIEKGAESILTEKSTGNIYKLTAEDIFKAAFEGDNVSREAIRDAGRHLGIGIANLINLLSPSAIILSGGLIGAWDIYTKEAIKEAGKRSLKSLFEGTKIIPAVHSDNAGILGAAYLALRETGLS